MNDGRRKTNGVQHRASADDDDVAVATDAVVKTRTPNFIKNGDLALQRLTTGDDFWRSGKLNAVCLMGGEPQMNRLNKPRILTNGTFININQSPRRPTAYARLHRRGQSVVIWREHIASKMDIKSVRNRKGLVMNGGHGQSSGAVRDMYRSILTGSNPEAL